MSELKYKRIGLYCNQRKPQALALGRSLAARLRELGAEPVYSREVDEHFDAPGQVADRQAVCANSDALVVLGGDGTLIWAARDSYNYQIPILGVSQGYLGFLSETSIGAVDEQLRLLVEGKCLISKRMALSVEICQPGLESACYCSPVINEVHVYRASRGRILDLYISINGELVSRYRADGILVSTPTGSTGHSLSAGGPILKPEMQAIVLTPICPHTLATRSIVVDPKDVVEIRLRPQEKDICLTVDGQIDNEIGGGHAIRVKKADYPIHLVQPGQMSFYEVLRKKLYLGEFSAADQPETFPSTSPL